MSDRDQLQRDAQAIQAALEGVMQMAAQVRMGNSPSAPNHSAVVMQTARNAEQGAVTIVVAMPPAMCAHVGGLMEIMLRTVVQGLVSTVATNGVTTQENVDVAPSPPPSDSVN